MRQIGEREEVGKRQKLKKEKRKIKEGKRNGISEEQARDYIKKLYLIFRFFGEQGQFIHKNYDRISAIMISIIIYICPPLKMLQPLRGTCS